MKIIRMEMGSLTETFTKGSHTIIHGDAIDSLERVQDQSVALIFADPPYNIGKRFANSIDKWPSDADYAKWCERWLTLCISKLTANGSMYVMTSTQCMPYLDLFLREQIHVINRIVWRYDSSGVQAKNRFGSMYEPILFCSKSAKNYQFNGDAIKVEAKTGSQRKLIDYRKTNPTPYNTSKIPGNVWYFPRVRYRMPEYEKHPTQKPESLLERIILASSEMGDTVLDPFSGTFTTSAVAKKLNRKSIGIEYAEEYVKIGLRRLSIRHQYKGEQLVPLSKPYHRKNGAVKSKATKTDQRSLFNKEE